MPTKKTHIYLLPTCANKDNLESIRHETEHESKVRYCEDGLVIELSEINSLIEERYCLSIMSSIFILEGTMSKEAMIHHHPHGHPWKHLQFKLEKENKVIRINLEPVDERDYEKCIKGFLHISQDLIKMEQQENKIEQNLIDYFFDDNINDLEPYRAYLLKKIKLAYEQNNMLNDSNYPINPEQLKNLRSEKRLLPFLDW